MVPEYLGAIPGGHTQGNSRGNIPLQSLSQSVFSPPGKGATGPCYPQFPGRVNSWPRTQGLPMAPMAPKGEEGGKANRAVSIPWAQGLPMAPPFWVHSSQFY